jgi:hypothetical protein
MAFTELGTYILRDVTASYLIVTENSVPFILVYFSIFFFFFVIFVIIM